MLPLNQYLQIENVNRKIVPNKAQKNKSNQLTSCNNMVFISKIIYAKDEKECHEV